MEITKRDILNSLKLYNIEDKEYINKCLECIDKINKSIYLKIKVTKMLNKIYINTAKDLRDKYKSYTKENFFNECVPDFTTNIVLLLGYKRHIKEIKKMNIECQKVSISRVSQCLKSNDLKEINVSQMLWGIYIIIGRILDVGRLQYEKYFFNPINKKKENIVKIHIPSGEKLVYSEVLSSLKESKVYIKKYFKLNKFKYYCISWILSDEVLSVVDENSNIAKFNRLFKVVAKEDGTKDVLHFVFNTKCDDYLKLDENTTLQKGLKKKLLKGEKIYKGIGELKKNVDF